MSVEVTKRLNAENRENYESTGDGKSKQVQRQYDSKRKRLNDPSLAVQRKDTTDNCKEQFGDFESALAVAGGFGKYQLLLMLVVQWSITQFAGNYVIMPLATYVPQVRCSLEPEANETGVHRNIPSPAVAGSNYGSGGTMDEIALQPLTHDLFCSRYTQGECANITWSEPYFHTIIQEWALICAFDYVPELINSIQTAGNFVALILIGMLSDKLGRKNICCVCFGLLLIVNPFSITASSWHWFAASRCVVGALTTAASTVMFVWSMECVDTEHNMLMNIANMWHMGYIISSVIGYVTKAWRRYLVVVNIIGMPILVLFCSLVESPRWLVQQGKLEQAATALTRIGQLNGKKIRFTAESLESIPRQGHEEEQLRRSGSNDNSIILDAVDPAGDREPPSCDVFKLFSDAHLACCTLMLIFLSISVSCVSSAYLFQVSLFQGDPTLKFLLFGLLRIASAPLVFAVDKFIPRWGRREMVYVPFFFIAISLSVAASSKLGWLDSVLSTSPDNTQFAAMLSAAVMCNFLWVGTGQYTVELFPTTLRNTAAGFTSLFDPLAAIFVQQLVYMEHYWPPVLMVVVLCNTMVATVLAYVLLPETKGQALPDSIQQADETHIEMHTIGSTGVKK